MHWIYLIHEFHNLSWITEINELFHDILIYWDAPVDDLYFSWKQWFEVKKHLNSGFVSYTLHKTLTDGLEWCGLLWCFYQLFGLSFWRHPFTAEDPLLSKWWNATFLQIWWRNKLIYILDDLRGGTHFQQIFIFEWTIPLISLSNSFNIWYLFIYLLLYSEYKSVDISLLLPYFKWDFVMQFGIASRKFSWHPLSLSLSSPSLSPPLTHQYVPTFPLQSVGHMNPPPPFCLGLPPIPPLPLSLSLSLGKYCLIPLSLSLSLSINRPHSFPLSCCMPSDPLYLPYSFQWFFSLRDVFRDFLNSSVPVLSLLTSSLSIVIFSISLLSSSHTCLFHLFSPVHGHTHTNNSSEIIYEFFQRNKNKGKKCYEFWQSKTLMLLSELWKNVMRNIWVHNEISDFWLQTILAHLSTV